MRPVLRPGLRLHRAPGHRAALVDHDRVFWLDEVTAALLESLDGLLDEEALLRRHPGAEAAAAWQRLRDSAVVVDVDEPARLLRGLDEEVRADAHAETTALVGRDPGAASRRWRARRTCTVALAGHGAVTDALRCLLRQSAVGHVVAGQAERADVVVLTHDHEPPTDEAERLLRAGVPHLVAGVRGTGGVVGPFVLPGTTGCLRCVDLCRAAADPGWAALRDQLAQPVTGRPLPAPAGAPVVAVLAGLAAADVLLQVEGSTPATLDATLSVTPDRPLPARKSWTTHPACGCSWHAEIGSRGEWSA